MVENATLEAVFVIYQLRVESLDEFAEEDWEVDR